MWTEESLRELLLSRPERAQGTSIRYEPSGDLPKVLDLFAGCGGLSLGLQAAGYEVVAGFDNWDPALDVYRKNFDHPAIKLDLSNVTSSVAALTPWMEGVDMIVGGPPCQDFSSAGKRVESTRADLTEDFASIVLALRPKIFVMENVARAQHARAFLAAEEMLASGGYGITRVVLDASRCGVPQSRKRLFTIGIQGEGHSTLLDELSEAQANRPMTVRDYLGDELDLNHYYRHPRSYARRAIFTVDEPSPTIRGVNRPVAPGYPGHPGDAIRDTSQVRPLTTRERALIQTFPADFYFGSTSTSAEQMIGNAVPAKLGEFVGRVLASHLRARGL